MGGKFHLKLNNGERPIANKYREGKMKRTLKRELKVLEIAKREALKTSDTLSQSLSAPRRFGVVQWATLSASPKGWLGVYDLVSVKINSELWEKVMRKVGEQSLLYPCYSTSAWIEEVMVRRLRLGPASLLSHSL